MNEVNIEQKNNELLINGVISFDSVEPLLAKTKAKIKGHAKITINLHNVASKDSASLAYISAILRFAQINKIKIKLVEMPVHMLDLCRVCGLDEILLLTDNN